MVELGGRGGGVGCIMIQDPDVAGKGTAFGGVVESGEFPQACFVAGIGGNGGGPLSPVLFVLDDNDSDV